jgi:ketosteroid isomerase-like protein
MARPGFALHFAPTRVEVAGSKDLAFDVGTFALNLDNDKAASITIPGKYVVVWKKQDGQWQVEADIFNTDK